MPGVSSRADELKPNGAHTNTHTGLVDSTHSLKCAQYKSFRQMLSVCLVRWIRAGVTALPSLPLKIFHTWWLHVLVVTDGLIYSYLLLLHPATHSHAMHAFPVHPLKAACRVWLANTPSTCASTWHMCCSVRWVAAPVPPVSGPSARHPSITSEQ